MALTAPRKPARHHRKARGAHHRHSKEYVKTYLPYLPLLLLVVIGLAINNFWIARYDVLGAATSLTSSELLVKTNIERGRQQQPDLALNSELNQAAQAKANDMVQRDYWSHNGPDGTTPWSFVQSQGYVYEAAGENLAYGFMNAEQVLQSWMNSPAHKANILNRNFQDVGFGMTTSENFQGKGPATVVVAMYGQRAASNLAVTASVSGTDAAGVATTKQPFRNVSRFEVLTGSASPWNFAVLSALTLACLAVLVFRHAFAWHRFLVRSEAFVLRHKAFDLIVLSALLVGFILTRTAGVIN